MDKKSLAIRVLTVYNVKWSQTGRKKVLSVAQSLSMENLKVKKPRVRAEPDDPEGS